MKMFEDKNFKKIGEIDFRGWLTWYGMTQMKNLKDVKMLNPILELFKNRKVQLSTAVILRSSVLDPDSVRSVSLGSGSRTGTLKSRVGELANFSVALAPDFFFKRLQLLIISQVAPAPVIFFRAALAPRGQKMAPAPDYWSSFS